MKYHGEVHYILDPNNNKLKEQYEDFKSRCSEIIVELILLKMADTLGSQLKQNNPEEFDFRIDFYKKAISDFEKIL